MPEDDGQTERINITMDEDLKRRIRVEAAMRDKSMAELAREILEKEFDEEGEGDSGNPKRAAPMTAD